MTAPARPHTEICGGVMGPKNKRPRCTIQGIVVTWAREGWEREKYMQERGGRESWKHILEIT